MTTRVVRNSFYVREELASNTPSRLDEISEEEERIQRAFACGLIQEAGILLRLPQVVLATGQVLFHRFYHRVSLKKFNHLWGAAAALFLAAKVEEVPKKIRDIITTVHHRFVKNQVKFGQGLYGGAVAFPLDLNGTSYYEWKQKVAEMEMYILKELGFVLHVEHPHKFILIYVNTMKEHSSSSEEEAARWKSLLQRAWNYANDALRTDLCVRYEPEIIACGCIDLASHHAKIKLPEDNENSWWAVFGVTKSDIEAVERTIEAVYPQSETLQFKDLTGKHALEDVMKDVLKQKALQSIIKMSSGGSSTVPVRAGDNSKRESNSAAPAIAGMPTENRADDRTNPNRSSENPKRKRDRSTEDRHSKQYSSKRHDGYPSEHNRHRRPERYRYDSPRHSGERNRRRSLERRNRDSRKGYNRYRSRSRSLSRSRSRSRSRGRDRNYRSRSRSSGRDKY